MASEKEASALEETVVGLLKKKKMTLSLVVMSHIQTAPKENVLE